MKRNLLPAPVFEPTTIRLISSCVGITFLLGIIKSPINYFAPIGGQYSEGPSGCH